jgi:hypothetical protein
MFTFSSFTKESEALLILLGSENQSGIGFSHQPHETERIWIQESKDFQWVYNYMRDDLNNCPEDYDVTLLVRLALYCWDSKLPTDAKDVKALCRLRLGHDGIKPDSPLYGLWTLFLSSNKPLIKLITASNDPDLQPKVLLEQAELLLDWHYRRIQRLNRQFGGDPRSRTDTEWFMSNQKLALGKKKSKARDPNIPFDRDFVPLMLAAKVVMHFHPRSSLLHAFALAPIHYAVGEWGYEYWFRRTLLKHCANQQGWRFLLMNLPRFEPEELMFLMSRVPLCGPDCEMLIESFEDYFDDEREQPWCLEQSEYLDYFEAFFLGGNLLDY